MKAFKKIATIGLFAILGMISTFIVNYFILEKLIIPDPCYYHSHDTTKLFDLFYSLTSAEGFHPIPTILNFSLTLTIGILIGVLLSIWWINKKASDEKVVIG